ALGRTQLRRGQSLRRTGAPYGLHGRWPAIKGSFMLQASKKAAIGSPLAPRQGRLTSFVKASVAKSLGGILRPVKETDRRRSDCPGWVHGQKCPVKQQASEVPGGRESADRCPGGLEPRFTKRRTACGSGRILGERRERRRRCGLSLDPR